MSKLPPFDSRDPNHKPPQSLDDAKLPRRPAKNSFKGDSFEHALNALRRLDPGAFSESIAMLSVSDRAVWRRDPHCRRFWGVLIGAVDYGLGPNNVDARRQLLTIMLDLLRSELYSHDGRLAKTVERVIVNLQRTDPKLACELGIESLLADCRVSPRTYLATLAFSQKGCRTLQDLQGLGTFACLLLSKKGVDAGAPETARLFNVSVSSICDPHIAHARVSRGFNVEHDVLDVGRRLQIGADLALAVVQSDMRFTDESNWRSISNAIRGFSSIGIALAIEVASATDPMPADELAGIKRHFGTDLLWEPIDAARPDASEAGQISVQLVSRALSITDGCFDWNDGDGRVSERFVLDGSTVNSLIMAIDAVDLRLDDARLVALSRLLMKAQHSPSTRTKLHSDRIAAALSHIMRADAEPTVQCCALLDIVGRTECVVRNKDVLGKVEKFITEALDAGVLLPESEAPKLAVLQARLVRTEAPTAKNAKASQSTEAPRAGSNTWFSDLLKDASRPNDSTQG